MLDPFGEEKENDVSRWEQRTNYNLNGDVLVNI